MAAQPGVRSANCRTCASPAAIVIVPLVEFQNIAVEIYLTAKFSLN